MCGIFGVIVKDQSEWGDAFIGEAIGQLARGSESRGKDSAGFAFRDEAAGTIDVLRAPLPITELMRRSEFGALLARHAGRGRSGPLAVIGHSRLVTNGSQLKDENNQPVIKDGLVGVHNGIIVNEDEIWKDAAPSQRQYDLDTEALMAVGRAYIRHGAASAAGAIRMLERVRGTVSTAYFIKDRPDLVLTTNNGSLYTLGDGRSALLFASEHHILSTVQQRLTRHEGVGAMTITAVAPYTGVVVDLRTSCATGFSTALPVSAPTSETIPPLTVSTTSIDAPPGHRSLLVDFRDIATNPRAAAERRLLEHPDAEINALRRCTKCVLPETFPFIEFDAGGICNYCRHYKLKVQPRPLDDLRRLVEPYRRTQRQHDCILPFSGGRDSTFTVHMVKTVLGMNPITLTYDWGMVTDLARRNIARVCGKLGVENVIVAADIKKKRENIRMNIEAWLKRPSLGMIPLFMSGDKYFFYYTNQLKKQTGIRLNIWGINPLENTDFKTGFAGVPPRFDKKRIYSLGVGGQLRFFTYVGRNLILNPAYFNSSNLDSLGSMTSRYLYPQQDFYSLFDYYPWNEQEIESVILNQYDWERAVDTRSTWRIGDGTASFYNYIYYTVAGFSENDTFRSNQIREGLISRERALSLVQEENRPRYENMKWYLDIVGVDFERAVQVINRIPKRYRP